MKKISILLSALLLAASFTSCSLFDNQRTPLEDALSWITSF